MIVPQIRELTDKCGCFGRRHTAEPDALVAIRQYFNYVDRLFLVPSGIPGFTAAKLVKGEDGIHRDRKCLATLVDEIQGVAIARDLGFIAVSEGRLSEDDRAYARLVDLNTLDAVGGNSTLDDGVFAQHLDPLR